MDQYVDNRQKEILWDILANPADNSALYTQSLERLVNDNPQSGLLLALLARTGDKQLLNKAAVYYNPRILYKLINHPADLATVDGADISYSSGNIENNNSLNTYIAADTVIVENDVAEEHVAIDSTPNDADIIAEDNSNIIAVKPEEEITEGQAMSIEPDNGYSLLMPEQDDVKFESVNNGPVMQQEEQTIEDHVADTPEQPIINQTNHYSSRFPKRVGADINAPVPGTLKPDNGDEVYDGKVSMEDIGLEAISSSETSIPGEPLAEARFSDPTAATDPEEEEASAVLFHQPDADAEPVQERSRTINEEEDRLILGGIVNTDYLSFDKKLDELRNTAPAENANATEPHPETVPAAETQEVSRYDDDKMPYTFMWWLNKTRKEHAENLQPYAVSKQITEAKKISETGVADELQQQYYENIFSLTPVSGAGRDTDPAEIAFDHTKKEDVIIERFIHTEPQIKPLSADKLDNENKAKKSSEDLNDFVTETLARIYTDQMLYHKAIATYKKLILKFPEKKLYFAAQIEQLEKKTN